MTATATCLKCNESFEAGLIHTAWFNLMHGVGCSPLFSTGYSIVDTSDEMKFTGLLDNKGTVTTPEAIAKAKEIVKAGEAKRKEGAKIIA